MLSTLQSRNKEVSLRFVHDLLVEGVENNYLRDEEWNMTGEGELGRLLTALAQNAGLFAKIDFDRSVNLAQQMERPELRLMAELKIAQGVLSDQPNPMMMLQPKRTTYRTIYRVLLPVRS
jgi:hypothetical protein